MERYQVILAYDGTGFQGYQRQVKARTVQGVFEAALQGLGWTGRAILAAGRTDTGVHASGQVVAFDLDWGHTPEELCAALNANLPQDIAAKAVRVAAAGFHPRYDAIMRTYRYCLVSQISRQPLLERYAWRVWPPVEVELLQGAAQLLVGAHDFAAFGTPPRRNGSTWRTVFHAQWSGLEPELVFEIRADAFLYRMVRRLVSFQVEIGQGKRPLDDLAQCLAEPPPTLVQGLAPPQGLTLVDVTYPPETRMAGSTNERLDQKPLGQAA
jgi:tRNA pseudouridine38-40 synthase